MEKIKTLIFFEIIGTLASASLIFFSFFGELGFGMGLFFPFIILPSFVLLLVGFFVAHFALKKNPNERIYKILNKVSFFGFLLYILILLTVVTLMAIQY
jgi:hypothetical protein